MRSMSRMLAVSGSAPNSQQQPPLASTPRPVNWCGVTEGMTAAKKALRAGQLKQAEQLLSELLEFAPAEIRAWKLLAKTQRKLKHIEAGIKSAKRALELQNIPKNHEAPASLTIAQLLWQQGEHKEARNMLELLVSDQPENERIQSLRQQWDNEAPE
jgi:predicted Zn-dependent protease